MRKSVDDASGPSSTITTSRPAAASDSALTPPPAPLPMTTTSVSSSRSRSSVAASVTFQPAASPSRIGWRTAMSAHRRRARIADRRPRGGVAVPRGLDELRERAVARALQGEGAVAPAQEEFTDLLRRGFLERRPQARDGHAQGGRVEEAEELAHLRLHGNRQARHGPIEPGHHAPAGPPPRLF